MEQLFNGAITVRGIALFAILIVFIYVWVFLVSMLDLRAGIRKAKKQGVYRSSKKLRRTVEKLTFYYNVMLALSFADMLAVVAIALLGIPIPRIPYLSFIGAFGVGIIEIKSIIEKAEDKQKADVADALAALSQILSKDELKELIFRVAGSRGAADYVPEGAGFAGEGEEI